jgi:hypothetical protein
MIIKPFSRQLKAAAETIAKAPSSMVLPPKFFLTPSNAHNKENESETIESIRDFVAQIPQAVKQRKVLDIKPGAIQDPVAKLFR